MKETGNNIFCVGVSGCNAYLVKDEKSALIEGVGRDCTDEYINNIEKIMPISEIDYVIFNHADPIHAECLAKILELNPSIEVIGTIAAIKNLKEIVNASFNEHIAKDGAKLHLGGRTLKFLITPNLPWPDTMMTYIENDGILFSCDAFGSYLDDESIDSVKEYYDNKGFLKPFALNMSQRLAELDVNVICTGSGAILKKCASEAIEKYSEWSTDTERTTKTAAIFYVSQYGYTEKMAYVIEKEMLGSGVEVKRFNSVNTNEARTALNTADILIFGTPTINRNAAAEIWRLLAELDLTVSKNKPCFVFGSYGWGGEGIQLVHNHLKLLRLRPFEKPFGCLFNPSEEEERELIKYTRRFLESI